MNKIYKVKKNKNGLNTVCGELSSNINKISQALLSVMMASAFFTSIEANADVTTVTDKYNNTVNNASENFTVLTKNDNDERYDTNNLNNTNNVINVDEKSNGYLQIGNTSDSIININNVTANHISLLDVNNKEINITSFKHNESQEYGETGYIKDAIFIGNGSINNVTTANGKLVVNNSTLENVTAKSSSANNVEQSIREKEGQFDGTMFYNSNLQNVTNGDFSKTDKYSLSERRTRYKENLPDISPDLIQSDSYVYSNLSFVGASIFNSVNDYYDFVTNSTISNTSDSTFENVHNTKIFNLGNSSFIGVDKSNINLDESTKASNVNIALSNSTDINILGSASNTKILDSFKVTYSNSKDNTVDSSDNITITNNSNNNTVRNLTNVSLLDGSSNNTLTNANHVTLTNSSENSINGSENKITDSNYVKLTGKKGTVNNSSNSILYGDNITINNSANNVILGNNASSTVINSVAIGEGSKSSKIVNTTTMEVNGKTKTVIGMSNDANNQGTVSIGDVGKERTLTNLAAGEVSSTSTDGINGSQLFGVIEEINTIANDVKINTNNINNLNTKVEENAQNINKIGDQVTTNTNDITSLKDNIKTTNEDVSNIKTQVETNTQNIKTVNDNVNTINGALTKIDEKVTENNEKIKDVSTKVENNTANISKNRVDIDDLMGKINDITTSGLVSDNKDSVVYTSKTVTTSTTNEKGEKQTTTKQVKSVSLNSGDNSNPNVVIDNVEAGEISEKSTQAINGSQLYKTNQQVINNTNNIKTINNRIDNNERRINNLSRQVENNRKEANAGIAGAYAVNGIPQVTKNGASGLGAAVGGFKNQSALAIGFSKMSDNGKHIIKLSGSVNTQNDFGGSAGYLYQW